jgi:hypothetical protein
VSGNGLIDAAQRGQTLVAPITEDGAHVCKGLHKHLGAALVQLLVGVKLRCIVRNTHANALRRPGGPSCVESKHNRQQH